MKTFQQFLKEDQTEDLRFRNIATKIAVDVLKHVVVKGFDESIQLSDITAIKDAKLIKLIPIENENKLGNTIFNYNSGKVDIEIRLDKQLLSSKSTFLKTLIHELIHALDMIRIPKSSLIQLVGRSKIKTNIDIEDYVNDPLELNAFYQEIIFGIELERPEFKNLQEFIKYSFDQLPLFFRNNLLGSNKQKILKRLAGYYQSHY